MQPQQQQQQPTMRSPQLDPVFQSLRSSIIQLLSGIIALILGILLAIAHVDRYWEIRAGVWAGVWMIITGSVGVSAARRKINNRSLSMAHLILSVINAVVCFFASPFVLNTAYLAQKGHCEWDHWHDRQYCYSEPIVSVINVAVLMLLLLNLSLSMRATSNNNKRAGGRRSSSNVSKSDLHNIVTKIVEEYNIEKITRLKEGKYIILGKIMFVRLLNDHCIVRIGGGWDTLAHYILTHVNWWVCAALWLDSAAR